jgi:hypothetical protein
LTETPSVVVVAVVVVPQRVTAVTAVTVGTTAAQIVHPEVKVKGFPTLLLFPAGKKKASVAFEGTRDLKTLVEFVKGRATVPFTLPEVGGVASRLVGGRNSCPWAVGEWGGSPLRSSTSVAFPFFATDAVGDVFGLPLALLLYL